MKAIHGAATLLILTAALAAARAAEQSPFDAKVLDVRPRVFRRKEPFEGLTIEKLRARLNEPEFVGVRQKWRAPDGALEPENQEGRLFCQTLVPGDYRLILHSDGKAEAFDPTGKSLGPVEGSSYHRQYGRKVVQIDPGNERT